MTLDEFYWLCVLWDELSTELIPEYNEPIESDSEDEESLLKLKEKKRKEKDVKETRSMVDPWMQGLSTRVEQGLIYPPQREGGVDMGVEEDLALPLDSDEERQLDEEENLRKHETLSAQHTSLDALNSPAATLKAFVAKELDAEAAWVGKEEEEASDEVEAEAPPSRRVTRHMVCLDN